MDTHDLMVELERLVGDISRQQINKHDVQSRLYLLYQQTSPIPTNPKPTTSTCACMTKCPHCNQIITVTLS